MRESGPPAPRRGVEGANELARRTPELARVETRNGLPVISAEDYRRLYDTDVREAGEDTTATFNFQGYVRFEAPDYEEPGVFYKDALATNGLLKDAKQPGIHVGTDGIVDYSALGENHRMRGPEQVGEYDIYITIPGELQRKHKVVCKYDSCISEAECIKREYDAEEIEDARAQDYGWIVMRTGLEPKKDPLARAKAEVIHEGIVKFIQSGGKLNEIESFARELEDALEGVQPEEIAKRLGKAVEDVVPRK